MPGYYSCALITGASSGLGAEFARQLDFRCKTIVLTARREERLKDLASELTRSVPELSVFIKAVDIASEKGRGDLLSFLEDNNLRPDLLINNAGFGDYGEFDSSDWEKTSQMLRVNMFALTHLTHALLPVLKSNHGAIINTSSLASVLPLPDLCVYAATKAYVSSFSEALRLELKKDKVFVLHVCPGPVDTEFGNVARRKGFNGDLFPGKNLFFTKKQIVVTQALEASRRGQARLFPGWKAKLAGFLLGFVPLFLLRCILSLRPKRGS